ncbi:hypothetical protein BH23THE1_BH23THE1_33790 [soil metagenome]
MIVIVSACSIYQIAYYLICQVKETNLQDNKVVMIFLVRSDIKMSKGQIAGKVADVIQYVIEECIQRKYITYTTWKKFHDSNKIVLRVNSERIL